MKLWIDIHEKEREGQLYENGAGKKIEHFSEDKVNMNDLYNYVHVHVLSI